MISNIFKLINGLYVVIATFLLFIVLKPFILIVNTIFSKDTYENFVLFLIKSTNYFFVLQRYNSIEGNKYKYDIRKYRDVYDRQGTELFFRFLSPEKIIKNKSILDVGCGVGGKDLELLRYNPKNITGIDLSSRNIKFANELINKSNENILRFLNTDLFNLEENNIFDTILSYTVFEHIDKRMLLPILNKMYSLLKPNGYVVIVFNHYDDKYGMHLKEYIYHPWPQIIFEEQLLYKYWNMQFNNDKNINENSYFPIEYNHGIQNHNMDCFMNLNKVTVNEFEKIIKRTGFVLYKNHFYSKSILLKIFPFLPNKYLIGSVVYNLKKNSASII